MIVGSSHAFSLGTLPARTHAQPHLAAHRCRKSNPALLDAVLAWYKVLRTLPGLEAAVVAQKKSKIRR